MQEAGEAPQKPAQSSVNGLTSSDDVPGSNFLEKALHRLKPSRAAAEGLRRLAATPEAVSSSLPRKKLAAVLVLLFINKAGELDVLLTTRALTLRTSPGETAFCGGRVEEQDADVHATAIREASEEVGLPLDTPLIRLTTLPPFLSYTLLYVVPVVYLLDVEDATKVIDALTPAPAEVSAIFTAELSRFRGRHGVAELYKHSHHDLTWIADKPFRLHAFQHDSFASDVTGLTADILISVAEIADGVDPSAFFERRAPGQLPWSELVQHVLEGKEARPRRAG